MCEYIEEADSMDFDTPEYTQDSDDEDGPQYNALGYTIYYYDTRRMRCYHFMSNFDLQTTKSFLSILNAHDCYTSKKNYDRIVRQNVMDSTKKIAYQRERFYFAGLWATSTHIFTRIDGKEKYRIIIPLIPGLGHEHTLYTEEGIMLLTQDVPRHYEVSTETKKFFRNVMDIYGKEYRFMFDSDETLPEDGTAITYESCFINQWDSDNWKTRLANITERECVDFIHDRVLTGPGYYYDPRWNDSKVFKNDLVRLLNEYLGL